MAEEVKYLIIGGGIAGTSAAETIRERDADSRVVIVSDEPHPLYSRVLLTKPNFFMEKIPFEKIWLKKQEWYQEKNIELWSGKAAVSLDAQNHLVTLDDGQQIHYEKLLLALGGKVRKLEVPGADKQGVFYLRTVEDTQSIIAAVKQSKQAVVVGGGIIGFECSEILDLAGIETTFVLRMEHYREPLLGVECSTMLEEKVKKEEINIINNTEVVEVLGDDSVTGVKLQNGQELPCQMVVVGIGCVTPFEWVKEAGVEVNRAVLANEFLETNQPDIYSAGDGTEFDDVIIGEKVIYGNWANAQKQGERAARNMTGEHEPFKAVTFFQTHGFGMVMTYVGDVRPAEDREVIQRGHKGDDIQERIFLKNNKIVGALLINAPQHMGTYTKLIEQQVDFTDKRAQLEDAHYEIEKFLAL